MSSTNRHCRGRQRRAAPASARRSRGSGLRMPTKPSRRRARRSRRPAASRASSGSHSRTLLVSSAMPVAARRAARACRSIIGSLGCERGEVALAEAVQLDRRGRARPRAARRARARKSRLGHLARARARTAGARRRARRSRAIALPERLERDAGLVLERARTPRSSGVVSTPPKSRDDRADRSRVTRGAARRSGRRPRGPPCASGRTRSPAAAAPSSSVVPHTTSPARAARRSSSSSHPQLEAGARAGGPRRRRSSTGAASAIAARRGLAGSSDRAPTTRLVGVARRRFGRADGAQRDARGRRRATRRPCAASAIRSQSGAPHECPRWPRQSTATLAPAVATVPVTRQSCS